MGNIIMKTLVLLFGLSFPAICVQAQTFTIAGETFYSIFTNSAHVIIYLPPGQTLTNWTKDIGNGQGCRGSPASGIYNLTFSLLAALLIWVGARVFSHS
jgi:hypothetical protein